MIAPSPPTPSWRTHSQLGFSLRWLRSQDLPQLLMESVLMTEDEQMVGNRGQNRMESL